MAVKAGGVDLRGGHWEAFGVPVGSWWGLAAVLWAGAVKIGGRFLLRHQLHKSCLGLLLVANPLQLNR